MRNAQSQFVLLLFHAQSFRSQILQEWPSPEIGLIVEKFCMAQNFEGLSRSGVTN